jgi:hypothetical protein
MTDFNKDDVLKVARVLVNDKTMFSSRIHVCNLFRHVCKYCNQIQPFPTMDGYKDGVAQVKYNRKHKLDCPVLIAQDLLTREVKNIAWTTESECYDKDGNRVYIKPLVNINDIIKNTELIIGGILNYVYKGDNQ